MFHRFQREISVGIAYVLLLLILLLASPSFFRGNQFLSTLVAAAPMLVAAIGMTLIILARHIDISIGSQLSVCAIAAGLLAKAGVPTPLVVLATLRLGRG